MYDERRPIIHKRLSDEPPEVRAGFVSKVYGILSVQLFVTALVATPFVTSTAVKSFVAHYGFPLVIGISVLNIGFLIAMLCCGQNTLREYPTNYMLLGGFTITEGLLVGVICCFYSVQAILFAVFATSILVGSLTVYAMTTEKDFTGMGPYLFAAVVALFIFGIICMFFPFPFIHKIYCGLGILLFSFYLIYDTQMIMGNGELCIGIDDYCFAALQLYIDIIQLFLYILQLFGDR